MNGWEKRELRGKVRGLFFSFLVCAVSSVLFCGIAYPLLEHSRLFAFLTFAFGAWMAVRAFFAWRPFWKEYRLLSSLKPKQQTRAR